MHHSATPALQSLSKWPIRPAFSGWALPDALPFPEPSKWSGPTPEPPRAPGCGAGATAPELPGRAGGRAGPHRTADGSSDVVDESG